MSKKALGNFIISIPFIGVFVLAWVRTSLIEALTIFLITGVVVAVISYGCYLAND